MRTERVWRTIAIVLCAVLPVGFYAVGDLTDAFPGFLTIGSAEESATARPRAQGEDYTRPEQTTLAPATATAVASDAATDLQDRMDAHAADTVVDGHLAFDVIDTATGTTIASRDADTARTPASTLKLLTATAFLREVDGEETLPTTAVIKDGSVTLVGGGDMRLTEKDLGTLAQKVATAIDEDGGSTTVKVHLDDTLFGSGFNEEWGSNGPSGGWLAPTAALAVNEGWLDSEEYGAKSMDPAMDAADVFVAQLKEKGLTVTGDVSRQDAPSGGTRETIESAPVSDLVAHTLLISDNTTAEVLGRLLAIKKGLPATAAGAAQAVQEEITELAQEKDIPTDGLDLKDVCGLAVGDRVPPALLAGVVAVLESADTSPTLRAMLTEVPISGLTGTLADRFEGEDATDGRGIIRGKTGYLGGTSTLAGVTTLPDGRTVAFSIMVYGFDSADSAEAKAAVDAIATELVTS